MGQYRCSGCRVSSVYLVGRIQGVDGYLKLQYGEAAHRLDDSADHAYVVAEAEMWSAEDQSEGVSSLVVDRVGTGIT